MKRVLHYALLLMLTLSTTIAFSQNPSGSKPSQFTSFPQKVKCTETEFERALSAPKGQTVSLSFSDNFVFTGEVISNVVKGMLQTTLIRSSGFDNTLFSISRIIIGDRSSKYAGRIINKKYSDGFELKQDVTGQYQLLKVETDKVLPDCRQQ